MTDVLPCKKCKVKPYTSCGHGIGASMAYTFGEIKCPNCGKTIRALSDPSDNSFDVLDEAIIRWNSENEVPFKEKKNCKTCDSYVDVGYKCKKKCLKDGKCNE